MNDGVLTGIRVLDATHAFAGPFCTHNLALLGADVIKVERPNGDDFRARPEVFASINAGKRSIALDLGIEDDRAALYGLVAKADVFVHNFRPDLPAKLGVDWTTLSELNPRLIYAAISGYGEGPLKGRAAIEWAVQASSGVMNEFVHGSAVSPEAWYPGISIVDPIAGYTAFTAVLAALLERTSTDRGQYLDIAMMDATLSIMGQYVANDLLSGPPTVTLGARLRTQDRLVYVAMSHDRWFESICDALEANDLPTDPRFATNEARTAHYPELVAALEARTGEDSADHWSAAFSARGVPSSIVDDWAGAAANPSVLARGLFETVRTPWGEGIVNAGGFRMDSQPQLRERRWSVPAAGEHNFEVLGERLAPGALPVTS